MRRTRTKLAIALLVVATIGATSAMASDGQFSDVPTDGRGSFAHEPAEWAAANGLTTGCNKESGEAISDTFCPDDGVTRGENITFTYRHHTVLIEPLLAAIESDVADNATAAAAAQTAADAAQTTADDAHADAADNAAELDEPRATGVQSVGFDDGIVIDSTTNEVLLTLVLPTTQTADVAVNTHVSIERLGAEDGRFIFGLHLTDCSGTKIGGAWYRPVISTSFLAADTVSLTGFADDAPAGSTIVLCGRRSDAAGVDLNAYDRGLVANW